MASEVSVICSVVLTVFTGIVVFLFELFLDCAILCSAPSLVKNRGSRYDLPLFTKATCCPLDSCRYDGPCSGGTKTVVIPLFAAVCGEKRARLNDVVAHE